MDDTGRFFAIVDQYLGLKQAPVFTALVLPRSAAAVAQKFTRQVCPSLGSGFLVFLTDFATARR